MQSLIFGQHEEKTIAQFERCLNTGRVLGGVLCADGHYGYSQPIGGVIAYDQQISPSGVGYDIACGNKAVRTNIKRSECTPAMLTKIMDDIWQKISFGVGRKQKIKIDHPLFDDPSWSAFTQIDVRIHDHLKKLAHEQLGTVGSGNHYVDVLWEPETDDVWIANHFGSRGFGHKIASGFLNLAAGRAFFDKAPGEHMDQPPTIFECSSEMGTLYEQAMQLAGQYAYAGRDIVIEQVLDILGAHATFSVHNHHNFAWRETHNGTEAIVVRKGATPLKPGQLGFIGGSMCDISVIVEGKDTPANVAAFASTVHGAGRIMSRTQAAGRMNWKTRKRTGGQISTEMMQQAVTQAGVLLRGGGTDESPFVYRSLRDVLESHADTLTILHTLTPIGVCMAGLDEYDPYKD